MKIIISNLSDTENSRYLLPFFLIFFLSLLLGAGSYPYPSPTTHEERGFCGRDSVYYITKNFGIETNLKDIGDKLGNNPESSMLQIKNLLLNMGLHCQAFNLTNKHFVAIGKLAEWKDTYILCALPTRDRSVGHFVVVDRRLPGGIEVYDPAFNRVYLLPYFPENLKHYELTILIVTKHRILFLREKIFISHLLSSIYFSIFCFMLGVTVFTLIHTSLSRIVWDKISQRIGGTCIHISHWKIIFLCVLAILCVVVMHQHQYKKKRNVFGHLVVDNPRIDLGELPVGATRSFSVSVKNLSDKPLTIDDVRTSCPCISVLRWDKDIPSGQSIQIECMAQSLRPGNNAYGILIESLTGQNISPVYAEVFFHSTRNSRFLPLQRMVENCPKDAVSHLNLEYRLTDSQSNPFMLEKVSMLRPKSHLTASAQVPLEVINGDFIFIDITYDGQSSCGFWNDAILLHGKDTISGEQLVFTLEISGHIVCDQCKSGVGFFLSHDPEDDINMHFEKSESVSIPTDSELPASHECDTN